MLSDRVRLEKAFRLSRDFEKPLYEAFIKRVEEIQEESESDDSEDPKEQGEDKDEVMMLNSSRENEECSEIGCEACYPSSEVIEKEPKEEDVDGEDPTREEWRQRVAMTWWSRWTMKTPM